MTEHLFQSSLVDGGQGGNPRYQASCTCGEWSHEPLHGPQGTPSFAEALQAHGQHYLEAHTER